MVQKTKINNSDIYNLLNELFTGNNGLKYLVKADLPNLEKLGISNY